MGAVVKAGVVHDGHGGDVRGHGNERGHGEDFTPVSVVVDELPAGSRVAGKRSRVGAYPPQLSRIDEILAAAGEVARLGTAALPGAGRLIRHGGHLDLDVEAGDQQIQLSLDGRDPLPQVGGLC